MTPELSVNLNAVAQLRSRRDLPWPSVVDMGRIALGAGAVGHTIHPRPVQRQLRFSDLPEVKARFDDEFPDRASTTDGRSRLRTGPEDPCRPRLTVADLPELITATPLMAEVSIGPAIAVDALQHGSEDSVLRYRSACSQGLAWAEPGPSRDFPRRFGGVLSF